jgi:hypothetical protein
MKVDNRTGRCEKPGVPHSISEDKVGMQALYIKLFAV